MTNTRQKKQRIFVGLSGGVDSSVAAARLLEAGHDVVGVFIKVWHPDFLECNWEEERLDAMRVAATLDIPFLTCDAVEDYKQSVADYFIKSYQDGETPNPDTMCNAHIKFGAFYRFARENKADGIATGHYARLLDRDTTPRLLRGVDQEKDQSYFLWGIRRDILPQIYFPIGETPKHKVREEAKRRGLPTAVKKDSQGICFLGHVDIPEFLSHYTTLTPGEVLDTHGVRIGSHKGAIAYTVGQRYGFTIETGQTKEQAHYVIDRDIDRNTITVATEPPRLERGTIVLTAHNWLVPDITSYRDANISIQTRYRQKPIRARITDMNDTETTLAIDESVDKPALGQSCVVYDEDQCLGGGIIRAIH